MSYAEFSSIRIKLADPEVIKNKWSHGEVTKPETINYRTLKPERDGLFCERIFGPTKDWECHCGKYKKIRFKGKVCDRCGVEVTRAKVRRERMGHIELAAPVSHIWYFKGIPSRMGLLLDISPKTLEKVLYFASYIVTDPGPTEFTHLTKNQILSDAEYRKYRMAYEGLYEFEAGMGAEAVLKLLQDLDLDELSATLHAQLKDASGQKKAKLVKRLEVVDAFRASGNKPEWMIITVLPVIPPELRPMVQLDGGRFATSDLNDLYRRVINRNNRLKRLKELHAPDIIIRNEKRMLQEAVDALIDNGRRGRAVTGANNRALKSLSDLLKGKQGRFRQNLLGKRVDYSGRSVIVVGPELKIYQCGVPKEMAIELFRPFVMKKLVESGVSNIKAAKKEVDRGTPPVWDALEAVIKEHPVMLNRAPTLHRLGIQAFEPVLVEGRAMKLHPLVCTAFNADFDGDQMAIHVPLSAEAQAEARILMLAANNLLRPSDGGPVTVPTQDMVLGSYYLTYERDPQNDPECSYETPQDAAQELASGKLQPNDRIWVRDSELGRWYRTTPALCAEAQDGANAREVFNVYAGDDEAELAYAEGVLDLHEPILVRRSAEINGEVRQKMVRTTVGRLIFNEGIPQDLGFVDRTDPEQIFEPEINFKCGKKQLGQIVDRCINKHGFTVSAAVLDTIKARGYKFSTRGALTVAIADMTVPEAKKELIAKTEQEVAELEHQYRRGMLTNEDRYKQVVQAWEKTTKEVSEALKQAMDQYNPIKMMADSGARGSEAQIRQLAGMRGLMADTSGRTIEIPVKANFREGLSVLEYFISSRGARKGMADTALRTADSGYLTRRLVDVSQEVIIREEDCGTHLGITVSEIKDSSREIETLKERLRGRYLSEPFVDPETGEVLVDRDTLVTGELADLIEAKLKEKLEKEGSTAAPSIKVRSVLTCQARSGVCAHCYGMNLAFGEPVGMGEAVGIIAAQSIGEPGTQLTMRTFHTGGVAGGDITQGLPRVEELFEARKPKKMATLAEVGGIVKLTDGKKETQVNLSIVQEDGTETKPISLGRSQLKVKDGQEVIRGQELTDGILYPQDVLRLRGEEAVHNYLIQEVQKPYRQQGVDINDKHIEVIVRQMMRKVYVDDAGGSRLLSGSVVDINDYLEALEELRAHNEARQQYLADLEARGETEPPLDISDLLQEPDVPEIPDDEDMDYEERERLEKERERVIQRKRREQEQEIARRQREREIWEEPKVTRVMLGITKASLATESFLSAASFQETTKVLTEAAIKGKVDRLQGLKENVIIGKLIPAGSGLTQYRKLDEIVDETHEERKPRPVVESNSSNYPEDLNEPDEDEVDGDDESEGSGDEDEFVEGSMALDNDASVFADPDADIIDELIGADAQDNGDDGSHG